MEKFVVVYDRNKMDSCLAAAVTLVANSDKVQIVAAERGEWLPEDADRYYWIGTFPSRFNFQDWRAVEGKEHIAITEVMTMLYSKHHVLSNVVWYGSDPHHAGKTPTHRTYKRATTVEQLLSLLDIDVAPYTLLIEQINKFYEPDTSVEFIVGAYVNTTSALCALEKGATTWAPCGKLEDSDAKSYRDAYEGIKNDLDKRSDIRPLSDKDGNRITLITTFADKNFWLIRRVIEIRKAKYRNIVLSVTGTNVITNASYTEGMMTSEPNFVI